MDTMGIVVNDVRTIGIPTFDVGVESGGASFYNGSLYLGIESSNSGLTKVSFWRIDFNSSFAPVAVSQQFAADGSTRMGRFRLSLMEHFTISTDLHQHRFSSC
jgi:hypothetical protein